MNEYKINALDAELSSQHASVRLNELNNQLWDRKQCTDMASLEDIKLSDEHWDVIVYLRDYYVETGLPRFARTTSRALNKRFSAQGGSKYLYGLFSGGPVTQGSRIANLRTPACATDVSFGTCY
ncbi:MAG: TusE/DsrC/DsvC family sulfur relay protein [Gammaproteobacteria bacterium]|nr:TusE/DsrC/DsvC family sulfur relay protein [Gammaproteobacteria bacterium]